MKIKKSAVNAKEKEAIVSIELTNKEKEALETVAEILDTLDKELTFTDKEEIFARNNWFTDFEDLSLIMQDIINTFYYYSPEE